MSPLWLRLESSSTIWELKLAMRTKSRSFVFTPVNWKTEITTEGQGYLDELAADVKTAPKAAMTGSSTFRIKCEHDGIHLDSLDVPHKPSTGDPCLVRTRVPRVSYTGDNFASMSSVLTSGFSGRWPTAAVATNSLSETAVPPDCPLHTEGS